MISWGAFGNEKKIKEFNIIPQIINLDLDNNGNNIWITDVGLHQVIKYDSNGKELMVLGKEFEPGSDSYSFNLPTDVAVANDGSFYVSDGYGNSRIIKFSKDGSYQFEWGAFGNEKSQFKSIFHTVLIWIIMEMSTSRIEKTIGYKNLTP